MAAIEAKIKTRAERLVRAYVDAHKNNVDMDDVPPALAEALLTLARDWREEANLWRDSKKKGWQTTATLFDQCAAHVAGVAVEIGTLKLEPSPIEQPAEHAAENKVTDYLRGDTDVIPNLGPNLIETTSVHAEIATLHDAISAANDATARIGEAASDAASYIGEALSSPATSELNREALDMTQSFPIVADVDPFSDPNPPGAGARDYSNPNASPASGFRYSFTDLLRPPPQSALPGHWSWSQLTTSEDCGIKYRAQRVDRIEQVPQWSLVGGNAFHLATASIDNAQAEDDPLWTRPPSDEVTHRLWHEAFHGEIANTATGTSVPNSQWRASARGQEGYDWWRVEGEAMLLRWVGLRAKLAANAPTPRPILYLPSASPTDAVRCIEWPFEINVPGPLGDLAYRGVIDRVWDVRADGSILIEDLKTGKADQPETAQLGSYAWAVNIAISNNLAAGRGAFGARRIMGTFYDARKGLYSPAVDLLLVHPWDEFVYRLHSAEAKRRAGIYTPRVSNFCVSCSVRYACPTQHKAAS